MIRRGDPTKSLFKHPHHEVPTRAPYSPAGRPRSAPSPSFPIRMLLTYPQHPQLRGEVASAVSCACAQTTAFSSTRRLTLDQSKTKPWRHYCAHSIRFAECRKPKAFLLADISDQSARLLPSDPLDTIRRTARCAPMPNPARPVGAGLSPGNDFDGLHQSLI